MADFVFTDPKVTLATIDLSDHVRSVSLTLNGDAVDDTNAGDTTRNRLGGLLDWTLTVEFAQDYATGKVDATLFSVVGTSVAIAVQPDNAAKATDNPSFEGNAILTGYQPVGGKIGDLATTSVTFLANGTLSRDTTP